MPIQIGFFIVPNELIAVEFKVDVHVRHSIRCIYFVNVLGRRKCIGEKS